MRYQKKENKTKKTHILTRSQTKLLGLIFPMKEKKSHHWANFQLDWFRALLTLPFQLHKQEQLYKRVSNKQAERRQKRCYHGER